MFASSNTRGTPGSPSAAPVIATGSPCPSRTGVTLSCGAETGDWASPKPRPEAQSPHNAWFTDAASPSLAAAALILFVEILKELPATLILRPFNFDTLAVKAYSYASDERLLEAAAPALLIFLAGLAPIIILARNIERGRAGIAS